MFYLFRQNNSGGTFEVDDKICRQLFVEADTEDDAIYKAEELGCYWNGVAKGLDCPCCGDRWYPNPNTILLDEYATAEEYAQLMADEYGWTSPDARIYYKDGRVKEIYKKRI